jgi:hypothetical protein
MKVIDEESAAWILLQHGRSLFLDVNCTHSFAGYSWLVKLNRDERRQYRGRGRTYLDELAHSIHYSAPAAADSTSPYKDRDCRKKYGDQVNAALRAR